MNTGTSTYQTLFSPISINQLKLENRLMMSPTHDGLADPEGFVEQKTIEFYLKRAKGGVGMVGIGAVDVNPRKSPHARLTDDRFIPGWRLLVDRIHSESNAKVCPQLIHARKMARGWQQDISDLSIEEVTEAVDLFEAGAVRALKAGFDAIEIHAAHGYTISGFLSLRNRRKDEYGGSIDGRIKILADIYQRVRAVVGGSYPVGVRINGDEFIVGGNTLQHTRIIARKLAEMGFDYISVSAGGKYEDSTATHPKYGSPWPYPSSGGYSGHRCMPPAQMPEAVNVYLAADLRKTVRQAGYSTPIITAGRIPYPKLAEAILATEQADLIGLSRPLLRDPNWPIKAREGREKEITRCTYCNECMDRLIEDEPGLCIYLNE
ncbi:MAG: NADH:flavin oxidoreductase [Dehalococcoidia bacterium]|nr:NADH:flavin oxidoreductase [Dehalococcoidia bacterium]